MGLATWNRSLQHNIITWEGANSGILGIMSRNQPRAFPGVPHLRARSEP